MIRFLLLFSCSLSLSASNIPELLDIRANRQPLIDVLVNIAKQCDAGLIVYQSVQKKVGWEANINARKATWPDASRWLADEYRLTMRLNGEYLEIGDADAEFRARLVSQTYDLRTLNQPSSDIPAPMLDIPSPGEFGSRLLPPIEPKSVPEINEFIELVQNRVAPNTWEIAGVAIEEYNGAMVITQVPEVHKQIAEFIADLEKVAARQIIVRCYRLPAADENAPISTIVDANTWAAMVKTIGNPVGVFQILDEQRNHHFSGQQSAHIIDADVNQEAFDPIITVLSQGLSIDVDAHVTHAGVVANVRFNASSNVVVTQSNIISTSNALLAPLDLIANDIDRSRDTRIITNNGAAIYHFGNQRYAISFEILHYEK